MWRLNKDCHVNYSNWRVRYLKQYGNFECYLIVVPAIPINILNTIIFRVPTKATLGHWEGRESREMGSHRRTSRCFTIILRWKSITSDMLPFFIDPRSACCMWDHLLWLPGDLFKQTIICKVNAMHCSLKFACEWGILDFCSILTIGRLVTCQSHEIFSFNFKSDYKSRIQTWLNSNTKLMQRHKSPLVILIGKRWIRYF